MKRLNDLFHKADVKNRKVLNKAEFVHLIDMANKDGKVHFGMKWPDASEIRMRRASLERIGARPTLRVSGAGIIPSHAYAENTADSNQLHVDADEAWNECRKVPLRATDARGLDQTSSVHVTQRMLGVSFAGFEAYWKTKMNIKETDITVLPEFMVRGNARTYTVVPDAQRDRETERQTKRQRDSGRDTERQRDRERDKQRDRQTNRQTGRQGNRAAGIHTDSERQGDREGGMQMDTSGAR